MIDSTLPVFLVDKLPAEGHTLLTGDEARHAVTVRRIRSGERIVLTDGRGGLASCVVGTVRPGREPSLECGLERSWHEPSPTPQVTIAQALAKGDRGELAVELATEAGADAIRPWRAKRSVAHWDDGQRGAKALARWRSTVRSAAKQARRPHIPEVASPMATGELCEMVSRCALALVLDAAADERINDVVVPGDGDVVVIVGPEGGITVDELSALREAGARRVRLGSTVLRTSTAAAVALGALGVLSSRWD